MSKKKLFFLVLAWLLIFYSLKIKLVDFKNILKTVNKYNKILDIRIHIKNKESILPDYVFKISTYLKVTSCFVKCLVLSKILFSNGIRHLIKIGVKKEEGTFKSHSWIEIENKIIDENSSQISEFEVIQIIEN